ncbi:hypothetical protein ACFFLZ_00760 [Photobacterium aphoticum]|nr:hypothetical protein [Photobacterium aphoticum]
MMSDVKRISREKFTSSLIVMALVSLCAAGLSIYHYQEALLIYFDDERVLTYVLAGCAGGMALILALGVIRGILVLKGVIKTDIEFIN